MKRMKINKLNIIIILATTLIISVGACNKITYDPTPKGFETDYYIGKYIMPAGKVGITKWRAGHYKIDLFNDYLNLKVDNVITPERNEKKFTELAEKHNDKKERKILHIMPPAELSYGIVSISVYYKNCNNVKKDFSNKFVIAFPSFEEFMFRKNKTSSDYPPRFESAGVVKKVDELTKSDLFWIPRNFSLRPIEKLNLSCDENLYLKIEFEDNTTIEQALPQKITY